MEKCLQSTEFLREKPFIQLPKSINSMDMSSDAKLLYANLADLLKISELNNHRDERGLYVFCSLEYIQQVLGCKKEKAVKSVRELENHQLIRKRRMGQGRSNRYYLLEPKEQENLVPLPAEEFQKSEKPTSDIEKSENPTFSMVDRSFLESLLSDF